MPLKFVTIAIFVLLVAFIGISLFADSSHSKLSEASGLVVSIDSFPTYLETHPVISLLPKDASVEVVIGDNTYIVDGRSVYLTDKVNDKDVSIHLPEGYESKIGEIGLCSAIKEAVENNQIEFDTYSSKLTLLVKYHKLIRYSDCVGG